MTESMMDKMNNTKWEKWLDMIQTVTLAVILPWTVWVTSNLYRMEARVALVERWQESRPKFVTSSEQESAIMKAQDELRKELGLNFKEIQLDLKTLIQTQNELRLDLIRHISKGL